MNESKTEISDYGMLEYMIEKLYGRARRDIASALLLRFGSVAGVFGATPEELSEVEGITPRAALFFSFVGPAFRQAAVRGTGERRLDSEAGLVRFAATYFMSETAVSEIAVLLDVDGGLIAAEKLGADKVRSAVGAACRLNAHKVALVRYSPYGETLTPSYGRLVTVAETVRPIELLGMEFIDSIEYRPFVFGSMRRTINGERENIPIFESSTVVYKRDTFFAELEREILTRRPKFR